MKYLLCNETLDDNMACKETLYDNIVEPYKPSCPDKYYSDIIINYIKKYMCLENNDSANQILNEFCDDIAKDMSCLKDCLSALELLIFNTDLYVFSLLKQAWSNSRRDVLRKYSYINKHDYSSLFNFFLLMVHNVPYFLPHDDNVVPGCTHIFGLDKKRKLSIKPYKKYYEYKLANSECYSCMRINHWFNTDNSKNFNCYCENFF